MIWQGQNFSLSLDRPSIMAVVNFTTNSFYQSSRANNVRDAVKKALQFMEEGACVVDIGAEAYRPGYRDISPEEEASRVVPVVRALVQEGVPVSIDTRRELVAHKSLDVGAPFINDGSSTMNPKMLDLVREYGAGIVILWRRDLETQNMLEGNYAYNSFDGIYDFLRDRAKYYAEEISGEQIILDPGIGYRTKRGEDVRTLHNIELLHELEYPLLVGVSRKGFLGHITGSHSPDQLGSASLACACWLALKGVQLIRVHDVKETSDVLKIIRAVA